MKLTRFSRSAVSLLLCGAFLGSPGIIYAQQNAGVARQVHYQYHLGIASDVVNGRAILTEVEPSMEAARIGLKVGDSILSINGKGGFPDSTQFIAHIASEAKSNDGNLMIVYERDAQSYFVFAHMGRIDDSSGAFTLASYRPLRLDPLELYRGEITVAMAHMSRSMQAVDPVKDDKKRFAAVANCMRFAERVMSLRDVSGFPADFQRRHKAIVEVFGKVAQAVELGPSKKIQPLTKPWWGELQNRCKDIETLLDYMSKNGGVHADLSQAPAMKADLAMEFNVPDAEGWNDVGTKITSEDMVAVGGLLLGGIIIANLLSDSSPSGGNEDDKPSKGVWGGITENEYACAKCSYSSTVFHQNCPVCGGSNTFKLK